MEARFTLAPLPVSDGTTLSKAPPDLPGGSTRVIVAVAKEAGGHVG